MYGVIDIGSNTVRLVVYRVEDNKMERIMNKKYMVGLAGYINKDGEMTKKGMRKLVEVLKDLQLLLQSVVLEELYAFATAPLRNIINTEDTLDYVEKETGWRIPVLSGEEEARCGYYGLMCEKEVNGGIVADIGGGSTELVFFAENEIKKAVSMPVGSMVMRSRFVEGIVPTEKELKDIRGFTKKRLKKIEVPDDVPEKLICCEGGSARAAGKLIAMQYKNVNVSEGYDAALLDKFVHHYLTHQKETVNMILKVCPDRIHTIMPGITILRCLAKQFGSRTIVTVENGVREGYLWQRLRDGSKSNVPDTHVLTEGGAC